MSYKYQIGCGDQMGCSVFQLEHDQQLSKDELTALIAEAAVAIVTDDINCHHKWIHNFGDVHDLLATWLVANKGFRLIEYEVDWWVDTNTSVFDKADISDQDDKSMSVIIDAVNAAGYDKTNDVSRLFFDIRDEMRERKPTTIEEVRQILNKFCTDKLSYDDIIVRMNLDLEYFI